MAVENLNESNFEQILSTQEGIVLIDFWAPWCGPCRVFGPVFEAASEAHPDITFAKVDTQEEQGLAGALQITAIPTLMILRDGVLVFRQPGALNKRMLEELIGKVRELDMAEVREQIAEARQAAGEPAPTTA